MNRALLLTILVSLLQSSCWNYSNNNSNETIAHNPDNSGFKSIGPLINPEPNCDTFSEGRETKVSCSIYKDKSETEKDQLRVALNELRDTHDIDWAYKLVSGPEPEDIVCDSPKQETFHCTITNPPHVKSTFRFEVNLKATSKGSRDHSNQDSVNLPFGARNWGKVPIAGAYYNNLVTVEQDKVGYQTTPFVANEMTFGNIHAMCFRNGALHFTSNDFVYRLEFKKDKNGELKPFAKHFAGAPYSPNGKQTRKTVRLRNVNHVLHCDESEMIVRAAPGSNVAASTTELFRLKDDLSEPSKINFPTFSDNDIDDLEVSATETLVLTTEQNSVIYRKSHDSFKAYRFPVYGSVRISRIIFHPTTGELYAVSNQPMGNLHKVRLEIPAGGGEVGSAHLQAVPGSYQASTFTFDAQGKLYFLDRQHSLFRMDATGPVDMGVQYLSSDPAVEMVFGPGTFPENLYVRLKGKPGTIFENQTLDRIVAKRGDNIEVIAGVRTLIKNPSENPITPKNEFQFFAVKHLALSKTGSMIFNDDPNRSRISFLDPREGPTKGQRVISARKSQDVPSVIHDITDINVGTIKGLAVADDGSLYFTAVLSTAHVNILRVENPHSLDRNDRYVSKVDLHQQYSFPNLLTAGEGKIFYIDTGGIWAVQSNSANGPPPVQILTTPALGIVDMGYAKDTLIVTAINRDGSQPYSEIIMIRKQASGNWAVTGRCRRNKFELTHARLDSQGTLYYVQGSPMGSIEATSNPPDHRISMIRNFDEQTHCNDRGNAGMLEQGQIWLPYAKDRLEAKPGLACRAGSIHSPIIDSSIAKTYQANIDEICPSQITAFALRDNCTEPYPEDPTAPKGVSVYWGGTVGLGHHSLATELGQVNQFTTPCPNGDL